MEIHSEKRIDKEMTKDKHVKGQETKKETNTIKYHTISPNHEASSSVGILQSMFQKYTVH